jgi:hypothetical protein
MGFSCWCTVLVCNSSLHDKLICPLYVSFFLECKIFLNEYSTFILSPIPWLLISLPLFSSLKLHFKHFVSNRQTIVSTVCSITKISTGICSSKIHGTVIARYKLFLPPSLCFLCFLVSFFALLFFALSHASYLLFIYFSRFRIKYYSLKVIV